MKSRDIDQSHQDAVDRLAAVYVAMSKEKLFEIPDYGTVEIEVLGKSLGVGFWNWKFGDNDNRLVFIAQRKLLVFGYRKFISGVFYGKALGPRPMSEVECGDYD